MLLLHGRGELSAPNLLHLLSLRMAPYLADSLLVSPLDFLLDFPVVSPVASLLLAATLCLAMDSVVTVTTTTTCTTKLIASFDEGKTLLRLDATIKLDAFVTL